MTDVRQSAKLTRRALGALLGGGLVLAAGARPPAALATVRSSARIVVVGAGAAGTAIANRLVRRLEGATITLVDARREHLNQPGFSLVGVGLEPASYVEWADARLAAGRRSPGRRGGGRDRP